MGGTTIFAEEAVRLMVIHGDTWSHGDTWEHAPFNSFMQNFVMYDYNAKTR